MSGRIKYGETYESIAKNVEMYLRPRIAMTYSPALYPPFWDATITIFNRYHDKVTDMVTWYKNVLDRCFFKNANNKVTVGQTVLETNNIIVRIPENKSFKEFGEWINVPNDKMGDYFTLHQGDIVIKGEVSEEIEEYKKGMTSNDLLAKYKEIGQCFVVSNYQDNSGNGRITPHYFVSGE